MQRHNSFLDTLSPLHRQVSTRWKKAQLEKNTGFLVDLEIKPHTL